MGRGTDVEMEMGVSLYGGGPVDAVTPYCRPPRPWRPAAKCPSPMRHPAPATAQAKQMG